MYTPSPLHLICARWSFTLCHFCDLSIYALLTSTCPSPYNCYCEDGWNLVTCNELRLTIIKVIRLCSSTAPTPTTLVLDISPPSTLSPSLSQKTMSTTDKQEAGEASTSTSKRIRNGGSGQQKHRQYTASMYSSLTNISPFLPSFLPIFYMWMCICLLVPYSAFRSTMVYYLRPSQQRNEAAGPRSWNRELTSSVTLVQSVFKTWFIM